MNRVQYRKEALKAALSVVLCIYFALLFGWEKAYWSVIVIVVLSGNETFSHSILKGRLRLLGTLIGACSAVVIISAFHQQRVLFLASLCLYLAVCVYLSTHRKTGYMWSTAFIVCALTASVGHFDDVATFNVMTLRLQETMLGFIVYSFVNQFIWHVNTQDHFFNLLNEVKPHLLDNPPQSDMNDANILIKLDKLSEILQLPLHGSYRLKHQKSYWLTTVYALKTLYLLQSTCNRTQHNLIAHGQTIVRESLKQQQITHDLKTWLEHANQIATPAATLGAFEVNHQVRMKYALQAVSILAICLLIWIYLPVPSGFLLPMMASIYSIVLVRQPVKGAMQTGLALMVWGSLFILEYAVILPTLDNVFELLAFYFIHIVVIWAIYSKPQHTILKILASNNLVIFTMGALQLVPNFDMTTSFSMITVLFIVLAVTQIIGSLFNPSQTTG